jgi:hypothetical protein
MKLKKSIAYALTFVILISMILAASVSVSAQSLYKDDFDHSAFISGDWSAYNNGNEFITNVDGKVTALRGYCLEEEVGTYYLSLYGNIYGAGLEIRDDADLLARVKFEARGKTGWVVVPLDTPVSLSAGSSYVVAITTGLSADDGNLFSRIVRTDERFPGNTNLRFIRGLFSGWDLDPDWIPFPCENWGDNRCAADIVFEPASAVADIPDDDSGDYVEFILRLLDEPNCIAAQFLPLTAGKTYELCIRYQGPGNLRLNAYCNTGEVHSDLAAANDWVEHTMTLIAANTANYVAYITNYAPIHGKLLISEIWLKDTANPGVNLLVNGDFKNSRNFAINSFGQAVQMLESETAVTGKWYFRNRDAWNLVRAAAPVEPVPLPEVVQPEVNPPEVVQPDEPAAPTPAPAKPPAVKTGDAGIIVLASVMIISAAGVVIFKRKSVK